MGVGAQVLRGRDASQQLSRAATVWGMANVSGSVSSIHHRLSPAPLEHVIRHGGPGTLERAFVTRRCAVTGGGRLCRALIVLYGDICFSMRVASLRGLGPLSAKVTPPAPIFLTRIYALART